MPNKQKNLYQGLHEDGLGISDVIRVLAQNHRFITLFAGLFTAIAATFIMLQPNQYSATVTLLPIERQSTGNLSALLGDTIPGGLGLLASQAGIGKNSAADTLVTLLQTRTIQASTIEETNILPILLPNKRFAFPALATASASVNMQEAVREFRKRLVIERQKQGEVVSISFMDRDPDRAAEVANRLATELSSYLQNTALSSAKRHRLFIESQLEKAQRELSEYELALKNFQQANKIIALDAQTEASIKAYSELKSRVSTAQIELRLMEKSSVGEDPRVVLKRQEVKELEKQLQTFLDGDSKQGIVSFQKAPSLGLSYARLKRDLMVREKVFETLTREYELAKLQESQDDLAFQILDPAIPPDRKEGPKRILQMFIAVSLALVGGCFIALVKEFWQGYRAINQDNTPANVA
jgi:uncharacterized protein involved in exopolysaccharide biosynthesis